MMANVCVGKVRWLVLLCEVSNSKAEPNVRTRTLTRHFFFDLNPCPIPKTVFADQHCEIAVLLICPLPLFACLQRLGMTPVNLLLKVVCTVTLVFKFTLAVTLTDFLHYFWTLKDVFTDIGKCKLMLPVSLDHIQTLKRMFTDIGKCK